MSPAVAVVAQRSREIGVRIGSAVGFALAFAARQLLSGLLHGVTATDIPTLLAVIGVLGGVATMSVWLPARRALHVDPLVVLRRD